MAAQEVWVDGSRMEGDEVLQTIEKDYVNFCVSQ